MTAELTDSMRHCLNGKIVSLAQDGWSNIHNDPVLATCVTTDSGTYFLDATDTDLVLLWLVTPGCVF